MLPLYVKLQLAFFFNNFSFHVNFWRRRWIGVHIWKNRRRENTKLVFRFGSRELARKLIKRRIQNNQWTVWGKLRCVLYKKEKELKGEGNHFYIDKPSLSPQIASGIQFTFDLALHVPEIKLRPLIHKLCIYQSFFRYIMCCIGNIQPKSMKKCFIVFVKESFLCCNNQFFRLVL